MAWPELSWTNGTKDPYGVTCLSFNDLERSGGIVVDSQNEPGIAVVRAFIANLNRAAALSTSPAHWIFLTQQSTRVLVEARFNITGNSQSGPLAPDVEKRVDDEMKRLYEASSLKQTTQQWNHGAHYLCKILEHDPFHLKAFNVMLESISLALWTAFEVFSADLWEAAINHGPKVLVKNVLRINDSSGLTASREETRAQTKMIPISCLADYEYDLSSKMGSLLRDKEKVDFRSIESTSKAYISAFGNQAKDLFVNSNPDYANVLALSALRNALLHRAGVVDRILIQDMKKTGGKSALEPMLPKVGERIDMHGLMILVSRNSIASLAQSMVRLVDIAMGYGPQNNAEVQP